MTARTKLECPPESPTAHETQLSLPEKPEHATPDVSDDFFSPPTTLTKAASHLPKLVKPGSGYKSLSASRNQESSAPVRLERVASRLAIAGGLAGRRHSVWLMTSRRGLNQRLERPIPKHKAQEGTEERIWNVAMKKIWEFVT